MSNLKKVGQNQPTNCLLNALKVFAGSLNYNFLNCMLIRKTGILLLTAFSDSLSEPEEASYNNTLLQYTH